MQNITMYQVDAFTDTLFKGNPAAVCILDSWISDEKMQDIASENNLSETAFIVRKAKDFEIRWFTPAAEIELAGHPTLASAHVIFNHLNFGKDNIIFHSKSGKLFVKKEDSMLYMDFPSADLKSRTTPDNLDSAFTSKSSFTVKNIVSARDILIELESEKEVLDAHPVLDQLLLWPEMGVIITAQGQDCDFVSRFFTPGMGIPEDPVTGSAHTMLIPYWAEKLNKKTLNARQVSERGGYLTCKHNGQRVTIGGQAVTYMVGIITC